MYVCSCRGLVDTSTVCVCVCVGMMMSLRPRAFFALSATTVFFFVCMLLTLEKVKRNIGSLRNGERSLLFMYGQQGERHRKAKGN